MKKRNTMEKWWECVSRTNGGDGDPELTQGAWLDTRMFEAKTTAELQSLVFTT